MLGGNILQAMCRVVLSQFNSSAGVCVREADHVSATDEDEPRYGS
jgi:hypothetical protein